MLRLCIFIGFCIWASQAAYTVEEFNKRQKTVDEMNDIYQQYLNTSVYDTQKRKSIEAQMIKRCDTDFDKSDTWFVCALNDETFSLVDAYLKSNNLDIGKTKTFISSAFDTAEMAIRMGKSVEPLVNEWMRVNHFGYNEQMQNFMKIAADFLQSTYPFGQWVTVAFDQSVKRSVCLRPGTFSLMVAASSNGKTMDWVFLILFREDGQKNDVKAADDALARIGQGNGGTSCNDDIINIMKEANYQCSSDEFMAFAVLSKAVIAASDISVWKTREVSRNGQCKHFKVGILV